MSAESATRIKGERAALADLDARRPRTRVAIGVLVALVYFGILAFAGILISGAVNSLGDRGVVARATVPEADGSGARVHERSGANDSARVAARAPARAKRRGRRRRPPPYQRRQRRNSASP